MRGVHGTSASLVAFVIFFTVTSAGVRADDAVNLARPVDGGETGILLLQDGGVLTGQITRAADWYVLARGAGQMQIAQSRVQFVCRTLGEAYEFRRRQINQDKVADHLRLAEWCIRYDLRAEAARELADTRRIDPDQPRLALLERRLEKGTGRPIAKQSVYLEGAKAGAKPPLEQSRDRQAAGGMAPPAKTVGELPEGAVELFTRKVQPVLVNNCTTSGCHQPGSKQSLQLDRAILRGESNRRTTMRNLEAALALVDRGHPDQSPLLTVPRKSHGGMSGPILGPRQEQAFKHLVDWVALVVPAEAPPATHMGDAAANSEDGKAVMPNQQVTKADGESAATTQPPARRQFALHADEAKDDDSSMTLRTPHKLQVGAQVKAWRPRDAFDPEIFNRAQQARQGRSNTPPAEASTSESATTTESR